MYVGLGNIMVQSNQSLQTAETVTTKMNLLVVEPFEWSHRAKIWHVFHQ